MRDSGEKGLVIESMGGEELCLYNAQDCRLTALAWTRMQADLGVERRVYEQDVRLARLCSEMQWRGVGVDETRRAEIADALKSRAATLRADMTALVPAKHGLDFDPARLGHVRDALYKRFAIRAARTTPGGSPSTDNETLEACRQVADEETAVARFCSALLDWRLVAKVLSTYVESIPSRPTRPAVWSAPHSRAHFNWKPFGTVSGRLACRFQSIPRWDSAQPEGRPREIYVPAPGRTFVYYDVSQAEMRLAAYLSADPVFMRVASGTDVHAGNAAAVFPDAASKGWLAGDAKKDPARGKPYRDIAKNLGFAICYGAASEKVYATLLSKGFAVTMRAVDLILGRLKSAYRVYYDWVQANLARVRRDGFMRSPVLGRIRWFGRHPKPTEIANYPVQSALADIVNARAIEASERLDDDCPLVLQVHDSCVYDVPNSKVSLVERTLADIWSVPVPLAGGDLILPIDSKRGDRFSEL